LGRADGGAGWRFPSSRFQGTQDIPLNDIGRTQAATAGRMLGDLLDREQRRPADLSFVASPLGRARLTMELLRGALRLSPSDYAVDDRLREICYGDWEGYTLPQMEKSDPQIYAARLADRWSVAPLGGESYASRLPLVADWANSLAADTVVVGHVGTARTLMVALGLATPALAIEGPIVQGAVYVFRDGGLEIFS